jgi:hypothetical protein
MDLLPHIGSSIAIHPPDSSKASRHRYRNLSNNKVLTVTGEMLYLVRTAGSMFGWRRGRASEFVFHP